MDKDLLIIVHNGLNRKQCSYIDKLENEKHFIVFPEEDERLEIEALNEVLIRIQKYKKETNRYPFVLFAVCVGEHIIPVVTKQIGSENIIHIDEQGNRFA